MPHSNADPLQRDRRLQPTQSGSEPSAGSPLAGSAPGATPPLTNAELVQLQIRVIALENLVVALLADATEPQLERVRGIAASIFPRPGVEHRLTAHATAQMEHLTQRSLRL